MEAGEIRNLVLGKLKLLTPKERTDFSQELSQKFIQEELLNLPKNACIALFRPLPTEPDLQAIESWMTKAGMRFAYPRMKVESLEWTEVSDPTTCTWKKGTLGIEEPEGASIHTHDLSLILVPGLAFTDLGERIGRGKGFYDRALTNLPKHVRTVSLAYPFQRFKHLPQHAGDQSVSRVIFATVSDK